MGLIELHRRGGARPEATPRARARVVLVELPFKRFDRPSLGLELLRAELVRAGHACAVRYANLDFVAAIGATLYDTIASIAPNELLLGDLAFAPALDEASGRYQSLREIAARELPDGSPSGSVPEWLWVLLAAVQRAARRHVESWADELALSDADLVGFSCMFQTVPSLAVAKALRARAPDKRIVFGGACCEGDMGLALHESYPFIDYVCRGEGERALPSLAAALSGDGPPAREIPGLVWRDGAASVAAPEAAPIEDLDALPRPDFDDFFAQAARALPSLPASLYVVPFETSRGCWYGEKRHCTFCGLNGQTMAFRSKSPARALEEIRALDAYRPRELHAVDNIFDHRYFDTVLPGLASDGGERRIFFEIKSNLTRRQLVLLRDAGVVLLQPGIESLSTPVLARMRKGVNACQNLRLIKWAVELGIALNWTCLYGFPGETADDYRPLAELYASIAHLPPPLKGGFRVRIDRYAPLHFDAAALGCGPIRPAPAYALAHALPDERLSRIAYHFEPEADHRSFDYMAPLVEAVRGWREQVGRASHTAIDREGELVLFDRRPGAALAEATLVGLARRLYLACDAGVSAEAAASSLEAPLEEVRPLLEDFTRRRWTVVVDGRYLALAVRLDDVVSPGLPRDALAEACHVAHCERVRALVEFRPVPPSALSASGAAAAPPRADLRATRASDSGA